MSPVRIVHFSDPHAGGFAEDFRAFLDKRWVGVFNYTFRRRFKFDLAYLERFVSVMIANPPDVIVCTGDLTSTGQPGEFARVLRILRPLVRAKIPMIYVPGNHDYYVFHPKCNRAMERVFTTLNSYFRLNFEALPQKRVFKDVEFLIANESMPSNLISSCGYLRQKTSDFICEMTAHNAEKKFRVLIGHYPIIEKQPILRIRHRLFGQKHVIPLLYSGAIDLSLNGHIHSPYTRLNGRSRGEVCSGSISKNHCYAELILDSDDMSIRVQHYALDTNTPQPITPYQEPLS